MDWCVGYTGWLMCGEEIEKGDGLMFGDALMCGVEIEKGDGLMRGIQRGWLMSG